MNLEERYIELKKDYNPEKLLSFLVDLTKDNSIDTLDFHYSLLKDKANIKLFHDIRYFFSKRKNTGAKYLKEKIKIESDEELKSEALFILGLMNCSEIKEDVLILLESTSIFDIKNKCIVILGWLGQSYDDIEILSKTMNNKNENIELRSHAASSLRQIWFKERSFGKAILGKYRVVLEYDNDYNLDSTIIACSQDILKKKWGIVESRYGEISGEVVEAKKKAIKTIDKYLEN